MTCINFIPRFKTSSFLLNAAIFCVLFLSGCHKELQYDVGLIRLEKRNAPNNNTTEEVFTKDSAGFYSDKDITIYAFINSFGLTLTLKNISSDSIKILWNESTYENHKGERYSVTPNPMLNSSTRFESKTVKVVPTGILCIEILKVAETLQYNPGSYTPGCYISGKIPYYSPGYYTPAYYSGGDFLIKTAPDEKTVQEIISETQGKTVRLNLVVEIANKKKTYLLTFKVNSIKIN